jgi:DNA-binding LacI/PurR family transcriptional regulator
MPAKLKGEGRPTALLVAAPLLEPVLCVLRDVGLKIPRDISVIALASSELAVAYDPPINAVEFPTTELAAEAVRILLEQIAGSEGPPAPMSYQSEYVVRGSVASPPASRPTNG